MTKNTQPATLGFYRPHKRVGISFEGQVSKTVQADTEAADINNIVARYRQTGLMPHLNPLDPRYGELPTYADYHEAMNQILKARETFMDLPATLRERFDNDPAEYLQFVTDPCNQDELIELGLAERFPSAPEPPAEEKNPSGDPPAGEATS